MALDHASDQEVLLEYPQPKVAVLRLNRPDKRNALTLSVKRSLSAKLRDLAANTDVSVVILTGGDTVFAGGTDISEMRNFTARDHQVLATDAIWQTLERYPKPIIAAVNGFALGGGCELALHADIIVAGRGASFGQPEIRVGIMPGAGGSQRLLRAIGRYQTMRLVLLGIPIAAEEALRAGMVSEVVEDNEVFNRALDMARQIADMPPLSVAAIRDVMMHGENAGLTASLALERRAFQMLFDSEDQKEGMSAFLEKRRPSFKGR